jgi:hypothetical protein
MASNDCTSRRDREPDKRRARPMTDGVERVGNGGALAAAIIVERGAPCFG